MLKNQISEMKSQLKSGGLQSEADSQRTIQELKLKLQETEAKLAKTQKDLEVAGNVGVATKMNLTQCPNHHPIK